jgi:hypothetical protein
MVLLLVPTRRKSVLKWLQFRLARLKWMWSEPSPPIATYDNTADKYQRVFLRRQEWLDAEPKPISEPARARSEGPRLKSQIRH